MPAVTGMLGAHGPPIRKPGPQSVHVYWLTIDQVLDEATEGHLLRLLDDQEQARAARFRFAGDRSTHVAAHALKRKVLSLHAATPPLAWRFEATSHGKPQIVEPACETRLRFNLSHAHGIVAVAVSCNHEVGIDVEMVDPARLTTDMAVRFFSPAEVEMVNQADSELRTEILFRIWTLKEAYIKAVGLGLSIPLDSFSFSFDPITISFRDHGSDDPARWLFRSEKPTASHMLALAMKSAAAEQVSVILQPVELDWLLA